MHKNVHLRAHTHTEILPPMTHLNSIAKSSATLAPAAGAGLGKAMFDCLLADANFPAALATAAREGLGAMTPRRWDKETESWVSDPDYRVRAQVLFALLAQAEGEPVKRVQIQTHKITAPGGDIEQELATSPAARIAMRRILDGAEARARHPLRKVKQEPPPSTLEVD